MLLERSEIGPKLRDRLQDRLLLGGRRAALDAFTAWRAMLSQSDTLLLGFRDTIVDHDVAGIELDLDFAAGFADLHTAAGPGVRDRVPVGMQRDITFDVDDTLAIRRAVCTT